MDRVWPWRMIPLRATPNCSGLVWRRCWHDSFRPITQTGLPTWSFNWSIMRYQPGVFILHSLFAILGFSLQVIPGLVIKAIFDTISGATTARSGSWLRIEALWWFIVLYLLIELLRLCLAIAPNGTAGLSVSW